MSLFTPRKWFFLVFLACTGLMAYALWVQHVEFLDPCSLCILQRVAFIGIGLTALLAFIHNPGRIGRWLYSLLLTAFAAFGAAVAGRHVWLQRNPPEDFNGCGQGLNQMLDSMPFWDVMAKVFKGSGNCTEIDWTFLGLSMPGWTLIWYIGLALVTLWVAARAKN